MTTVTRIWPPPRGGGGGGGATALWDVEYEIDFTAQVAHDFTVTPTVSLGGVTWTAANTANATTFEIDGTGLRITPNTVGYWWRQFQTLPFVSAPLASMMTGYSDRDTVALQINLECTTVADNWDACGLAIWDGVASQQDGWYRIGSFFESGWTRGAAEAHADASKAWLSPDPFVQKDFIEIVMFPSNGIVGSQDTFTGTFPDPLTTTSYFENFFSASPILGPGGAGQSVGIPTWEIPVSTACFLIYVQAQSSTTIMNAVAKSMRVLRRKIS